MPTCIIPSWHHLDEPPSHCWWRATQTHQRGAGRRPVPWHLAVAAAGLLAGRTATALGLARGAGTIRHRSTHRYVDNGVVTSAGRRWHDCCLHIVLHGAEAALRLARQIVLSPPAGRAGWSSSIRWRSSADRPRPRGAPHRRDARPRQRRRSHRLTSVLTPASEIDRRQFWHWRQPAHRTGSATAGSDRKSMDIVAFEAGFGSATIAAPAFRTVDIAVQYRRFCRRADRDERMAHARSLRREFSRALAPDCQPLCRRAHRATAPARRWRPRRLAPPRMMALPDQAFAPISTGLAISARLPPAHLAVLRAVDRTLGPTAFLADAHRAVSEMVRQKH